MNNNTMFGWLTSLLIIALMLGLAAVAAAEGGKVNNPWQPIDPNQDVCTAFLPAGLDLSDCTELASTTSGITYLCETLDSYTVVCPTDGDDDDDDDSD